MIELSATPRIQTVSKQDFINVYKENKKPIIIEQLTKDWPARHKWNLEYLKKITGDCIVPLYDSKPSAGRKHQHAPTTSMCMSEYINLLEQGENNLRVFFYNILANAPQLTSDFTYPDVGLNFFRKLPVLFLAGKGAKVQMHFDIDMADLLLCHFGGTKRVILFPPSQTKYLYRVPFSFSSLFDIDYENPDYEKYPALQNLKGEVAILKHNDTLYIPPGYWHYVIYDDISFSMTLRAFPGKPMALLAMMRNILLTRSIDGMMRKLAGQSWNKRNAQRAISKTHKKFGIVG